MKRRDLIDKRWSNLEFIAHSCNPNYRAVSNALHYAFSIQYLILMKNAFREGIIMPNFNLDPSDSKTWANSTVLGPQYTAGIQLIG